MSSSDDVLLPKVLGFPLIPTPADDVITAISLGGCARIGMNATLYGCQGRWILVDAGSAFLEDKMSWRNVPLQPIPPQRHPRRGNRGRQAADRRSS